VDLYRVGTPSVEETWGGRWNGYRSTGGLGTGIYAYRTQAAADSNTAKPGYPDEVLVLENAVENPIQPATFEATRALNDLSRKLALVAESVRNGAMTWEEAADRADTLTASISSFGPTEMGVGNGSYISSDAHTVLLHTTELRSEYGLDDVEFVREAIRATRAAAERPQNGSGGRRPQPLNELLWPSYDGVAPHSGAGGDDGTYGCCILKQRVDECIGSVTRNSQEIPANRLNQCFTEVVA
jgi:hypothetical protein